MTTQFVIWAGLVLALLLAGAYAWKLAWNRSAAIAWAKACDTKLDAADKLQAAKRARDDFRAAELRREIASLKASKKKHSHLVAELQALMNRKLLWEQGA